ncbi:MFS transporter [Halioglobus maricola]|uniref:MFS transporter n=1 Tax=Halioglobus maricola TaxID=2601894 RepID=A0A5P9NR40_9GAMM|nr:MFS transporter [Halioglobus maricola]QFU77418.1 MFS transporter [Halioglobus maricola]
MRNWFPAFAGMACLGFGAGLMSIYGFFVPALSEEFGVGAATINIGPVALMLVPGLAAPFVGKFADSMPIRRIILAGCTLAMLGLVLTSLAPSLAVAGLCFLLFALGMTLYGPVVVNSLMVKLYVGREGKALALVAAGTSIASAVLPPLVGAGLEMFGWRTALAALALTLLVVLWLLVWLCIPADIGASVGGAASKPAEIYRRREFWLVGVAVALVFNVSVLATICYPPLFISRGMDPVEVGLMLSISAIAGLSGKVFVAISADYLQDRPRVLAIGIMLVQCTGIAILLLFKEGWPIWLGLACSGFGVGAFLPVHPWLNSRYFDTAVIGQVNGAQMPLMLPLALAGPPLAGLVFDRTGSYDPVLASMVVLLLLACLVLTILPRPAPAPAPVA